MDEQQNATPGPATEQAPPPPAPEPPQKPDLKANSSILSRREFITLLIGAGA